MSEAFAILIGALIIAFAIRQQKKPRYFCRFLKSINASEAERERYNKKHILKLEADGEVAYFWQKIALPFPPQVGMSCQTMAYSLKKNKDSYIPVRFNPENPNNHDVEFISGKIESIKWDGASEAGLENGTFNCYVTPYKMSEEDSMASVAYRFFNEGWRSNSPEITEAAADHIQEWQKRIESSEPELRARELESLEQYRKIVELTKGFNIGTLEQLS